MLTGRAGVEGAGGLLGSELLRDRKNPGLWLVTWKSAIPAVFFPQIESEHLQQTKWPLQQDRVLGIKSVGLRSFDLPVYKMLSR